MKRPTPSLLSALALAAALAAPAHAGIDVAQTNLVSDTPYLYSYRHQRHLFVTADGRYHLVANLGGQSGSAASLNLLSSDDGLTWVQQRRLAYTGIQSVSDGALTGNALTLVYEGNDGIVRLVTSTYDPATRSWSPFAGEQVPRAAGSDRAVNPSFTVDGGGNTWVAYVREDTTTGLASIAVYRKSATGTWAGAGQSFDTPSLPAGSDKRSARLVTVRDQNGQQGIGMMYSVEADIFWQERPLKGSANLLWNSPVTLLKGTPDKDPMSSHFSTQLDGNGNLFAAFTDAGTLYVNRRDGATLQWYANPQVIAAAGKPTYAQLADLGGTRIGLVTNIGNDAWVYQAQTTAGAGWKCTDQGLHTRLTSPLYFGDPRIEVPALPGVGAAVPVLQQFQDHKPVSDTDHPLQYAAGFRFTPGLPTGCTAAPNATR